METSQFEEAKNRNIKIEEHIFTFDYIANYATDILVFADLEKAGFNRKDKQILTESLSYKPYFNYQFFTFRDCKKDRYVCYSNSIRIEAPQLFPFFLSNYDPESNIINIELGTYDDEAESNNLNELIEIEIEDEILKLSHNLDFQSKRIEDFLDYHYYKFNGSPYEWLDYVLRLFDKFITNMTLKMRLKSLFNEWKTTKLLEFPAKEEHRVVFGFCLYLLSLNEWKDEYFTARDNRKVGKWLEDKAKYFGLSSHNKLEQKFNQFIKSTGKSPELTQLQIKQAIEILKPFPCAQGKAKTFLDVLKE